MLIYDPKEHPYNPALDHPLSPRGRFGRLAYLAWYLVISFAIMIPIILGIVGFFAFSDSVNDVSGILIALAVVGVILYFVFFYYMIVITIRRLHDLNQTGWLSLLLFVPIISIGFMLYVMFAKGTPATNEFGAPRPNKSWEVALGKIYIVLTVLGLIIGAALVATGSLDFMDQMVVDQMKADQMAQIEQMDDMDQTEVVGEADQPTDTLNDADQSTEGSQDPLNEEAEINQVIDADKVQT